MVDDAILNIVVLIGGSILYLIYEDRRAVSSDFFSISSIRNGAHTGVADISCIILKPWSRARFKYRAVKKNSSGRRGKYRPRRYARYLGPGWTVKNQDIWHVAENIDPASVFGTSDKDML